MQVQIKRLHEDAVIPSYAHETDAGFDLVAIEDVIVEPGQTVKVPTGLAFSIPDGYEMQIRPRSGITSMTKLRVQLGTVDAGYHGEVSVMVDNISVPVVQFGWDDGNEDPSLGDYCVEIQRTQALHLIDGTFTITGNRFDTNPTGTYRIRKGDRIAQAVISPVKHADFVVVGELDETERGDGGFGSTGV